MKESPKHMRYDLMVAYFGDNETDHPQSVMKKLGIVYQHSTPQSIADCWIFWNCENIPDILPKALHVTEYLNPMDFIGHGLSQQKAESIQERKTKW